MKLLWEKGELKLVPDFCLKGLRELCDEHEILLILDEVQSAYRTGNFFALKSSGIKPDIVPIAKGIGGGFSTWSMFGNKKSFCWNDTWNTWKYFWRKPLAMAVGNAVLDILFEKDFLKNVKQKGEYFHLGLNKIKKNILKLLKK